MEPLSPNEEDPSRLWAEIHTLREAIKGPDGYASWQDAAVAERIRRVKMERSIDKLESIHTRLCLCLVSVTNRLTGRSRADPLRPLDSAMTAVQELDDLINQLQGAK